MKTSNYNARLRTLIFVLIQGLSFLSFSQYCDSLVPTTIVDLSSSPANNWISAPIVRNGNCCGTTNPDNCLEFIITLHPNAIAVSFDFASGAVPPGALFYQIDCGPITPVGSPICLSGAGPHHLTFCKPGNNSNTFSITSYSEPTVGPDITLNAGCQGFIYGNYYNEPSISWTSIGPGNMGDYDYLLSCTNGCDTTYISAPLNPPAFIDFQVCGTDIGGCNPLPYCDTIRVNLIDAVDVSVSSIVTSLCAGETTILNANASGGSAPYAYLWSTLESTSSITVGAGNYYVDVVDASGCFVASDTITIQQYAQPMVVAGIDQSVCEGTLVSLSGSGALTYTWDNAVIDGVLFTQPVGSVVYTVIGTDINGCTNSDQVSVTVNANPIVSAGNDAFYCENAPVTLNGSGALTYSWSNAVIDGVPFVQNVGTTNYTVTGLDANGCSDFDVVMITVTPLPNVAAGPDQILCEGSSVLLAGAGASTYTWSGGIVNNVSFIPNVGLSQFTVTGTDIYGCAASDDVSVNIIPNPIVNAGPDIVVCEGDSIVLIGSGAINYSWSGGVQNGISFLPNVGSTDYYLTGSGFNGCFDEDTVNVLVNPLPYVYAGEDVTMCEGDLTLFWEGSSSVYWNNGVQNGITFTPPLGQTQYILTDSLPSGCMDKDTVEVNVLPNPIVEANDAEICEGEAVVLEGEGADSYQWDLGVADGVEFYPTQTGFYTVEGTDLNGCKGQATATVIVHESPTADFNFDNTELSTSNPTTSFTNLSTNAVSYVWDFNDGSLNDNSYEPFHEFPSSEANNFEVELTVTSPEGCEDYIIKTINMIQDFSIYVPNAFTPDNNGVNQVFQPILNGFDEQHYTLYVFNRWGQLVFESHDMNVGWDGSFASKFEQAQDGVYTWKILARVNKTAESKSFVGHVSLLK